MLRFTRTSLSPVLACLAAPGLSTSIAAQLPPQQVKLSGEMPIEVFGDVDTSHIDVSSDGSWVVYVADQDVDDRQELYAVSHDGSLGRSG